MARAPAELVSLAEDDSALLRASRRGDAVALRRFAERHFDFLYGVLRMTLPNPRDVELAVAKAILNVTAHPERSILGRDPTHALTAAALHEVADQLDPPISIEKRRRERAGALAPADEPDPELTGATLPAVRDDALAAMVRTLELRPRQALVLTLICGLDDVDAGLAIGRPPHEVARLRGDAIATLERRVCAYGHSRERLRHDLSDTNPYELASIGGGGEVGSAKVGHDGRVHLAPPPETSILKLLRQAMKRMIERLRRRHELHPDRDDVGGTGNRRALDPTPTQKPFQRPDPTPSIANAYRKPEASVGTASYRMPKTTPSTARLSNSSRPALAASTAWASVRQGRRKF